MNHMTGRRAARNNLWSLLLQRWPRSPLWRMAVLVPGVALLLVPVFMDKSSAPAVTLTAGLGIVALILPFWMNIHIGARDKRRSVLESRNEVLEPLRLDHPEASVALNSLLPRWSLSAFYGRNDAEKRLSTWLGSVTEPLMVIEGGPLVGKKRLAIEWADSLGPEWEAGWLRHDSNTDVLKRVIARGRNTIIVVDVMSPSLSQLLHDLSQHNNSPHVRVLLAVRSARALRFSDPYVSALVQGVQALRLGPLGETADRERWFEELCRYYADKLGVPAPAQDPNFIRILGLVPIGVLHVAALATARAGKVPLPGRSEDLLFALWKTETDSWRYSPQTPGFRNGTVSDSQLERLEQSVIALSLLAPHDIVSAAAVLQRIPALSETDLGTLKDIAAWVSRTYPPSDPSYVGIVDFNPSIVIAAAFLQSPDQGAFQRALLRSVDNSEALLMMGRLTEASSLLSSAAAWIADLVDGNAERLSAAIQMALAVPLENLRLDEELARCVVSCNLAEDEAVALQEVIPEGLLPVTCLSLQDRRVKYLREHVTKHSEEYDPDLASALIRLSALLYARGRSADALHACEEAVAIWRRLAAADPLRHEPSLASSVNGLGSVLAQLGGRSADALQAAEEAVGIWRRLAAVDPSKHDPGLCSALTNLVGRTVDMKGPTTGALEAAEESVVLYRRLATEDPEGYEAHLAGALNTRANILGEMGGLATEALLAAEESVAIRRRLAAKNPRVYNPDLAGSLNNLGNRLADVPGRRADGVKIAEEAVALYRLLAATNPERYEPNLAGTLGTLANRLADGAGRHPDALLAAKESLSLYRRLATANPESYQSELAGTLNNLATMYRLGERRAVALQAAKEAVALYRQLTAEKPSRYKTNLAGTLNTLANILGEDGGSSRDALKAAEESVTLFRELAAENAARHEPALAGTLTALGDRLAAANSWPAALACRKEATQIYERLVREDPRYREPLAYVKRMIWERSGIADENSNS
ncbi:hypothetical protein NicSoilE8_42780 (plasmid) [Arthrobacter sp. NicSoilE8]|nr:hypothetical protein NicSoilE8_42780 [Arthrobacter sp. NicSoilE8]